MSDERIKKAYALAEKYGTAERECRWHESGLDADDCFRDLMIYVKGLVARIAELEGLVRELLAEGEYLSMLSGLVDNDSDWKQLVDKANKTLPEVQE